MSEQAGLFEQEPARPKREPTRRVRIFIRKGLTLEQRRKRVAAAIAAYDTRTSGAWERTKDERL